MKPKRGLKWSANGIAKCGRWDNIYIFKVRDRFWGVSGLQVDLYAVSPHDLRRKINSYCMRQAKAMLKDLGVK